LPLAGGRGRAAVVLRPASTRAANALMIASSDQID
jgi:hypothetical protein